MKTLAEIRAEIDSLDAELAPLLVRRIRIADEVAIAKRAEGVAIDDPVREAAVLDLIRARAPADCAEAISNIYRTIFDCTKKRQRQ